MNIFEQFQKDFDAQFTDMKAQAKPYTAQELYDIDYKKGMKDAENGVKHEPKSEAYTQGYGDQYAYEQTIDSRVVV